MRPDIQMDWNWFSEGKYFFLSLQTQRQKRGLIWTTTTTWLRIANLIFLCDEEADEKIFPAIMTEHKDFEWLWICTFQKNASKELKALEISYCEFVHEKILMNPKKFKSIHLNV